ncbi:FAD-dependent oxidoreductase [Marinitenerispora sediminis]|uniref:ferredoxin--NADP(+) reductase n=1 Tax=Marinitenerispora sediminis TaxID=1931232 RepID=A0A368T0P3_9ACTN|nr:FAD-dependent oxidoreductase [Marinitenerispora sediminis]RCV53218.1 pyridine nucleotide-disulfide oxidoreductase [Marinitenerispora sediminis]RCV56521.1 pyridine nucleotide-disulfide oxidoreductase [Marinitenerispora sediminis]RCV60128.1 pyridine nucleotide-disulfide oxidoreductase [Marinitenerispora sediminis]
MGIVGAGPAGIYAADLLTKDDTLTASGTPLSIDIMDKLPSPYGLVRYGVAPDHPRIKQIQGALHKVLDKPQIRFLGNVEYGVDLKLEDLRRHYDTVIFATGSDRDRPLDIPGVDLPGSHGAADFVFWYDSHPDVPQQWQVDGTSVAVLGAGNVAVDVARILAKNADDLLETDITDNVHEGLRSKRITDVHVFARRGIAQAKFTPMELRELDKQPGVEVIVYPEDFDLDDASMAAIEGSNHVKTNVKVLQNWAIRDPRGEPRRLHLHFLHRPVEILGTDRVTGLRTERMELTGDGGVRGTGEFIDHDVQAVYRAIGYLGSPVADLPFDEDRGVIPNDGGRVLDLDEQPIPGVYATGWIKRGPVGLIGHTKGDALETIGNLVADRDSFPPAADPDPESFVRLLRERGVPFTTWEGWQRLESHEEELGREHGRKRVKVLSRADMTRICRGEDG